MKKIIKLIGHKQLKENVCTSKKMVNDTMYCKVCTKNGSMLDMGSTANIQVLIQPYRDGLPCHDTVNS